MSSRQLLEPITDSGIQNVNFFNGRLLTADDLSAVLDSSRGHDRQLAKGIGEGVVHGLEVELANSSTQAQPVVRVGGGLALCRSGNPVALSVPTVDVALVKSAPTFAADAGLFAECAGPGASDNLSKLGVYVFVASPASTYEGSVPMRHSVSDSRFDGCGRRYAVEGVKFRMERIDFSTLPGVSDSTRALLNTLTTKSDAASVSVLRNVVAHLCFDSEEKTGARRDPFRRPAGDTNFVNYGALAELRAAGQLSDCDVPLAVVYWSQQGVRFVDNWAARRLARRQLDFDVESLLRSYGYERLLQFQRHLRDLFDALGALSAVRLQDYFAFVPPAGYFPVTGGKSPRGFSPANFFKQFTTGQPSNVSADGFGSILRDSFACPDVSLASKPVFTVLRLNENAAAVAASTPSSQLYHAFVSRTLDGPLVHDGVAGRLYDAWEVYRGLVKKRLFIMPFSGGGYYGGYYGGGYGSNYGNDFIGANFGIVAAINDVLFIANRGYVLAAGRRLDTPEALKVFSDIHRVQDDLAKYLLTGIPFPDPTGDRAQFAKQLDKLLNKVGPSGKPALLPAIGAKDLPAAVEAQQAINLFVGTWSGQSVAIGPFGSVWQATGSSGKNLVPGHGTFSHNFLVSNGTDKDLRIDLESFVAAAPGLPLSGNWEGTTSVESENGETITFIDIPVGGKKTVVVKVTPPTSGVTFDQTARLTLRTSVAPPTNRSHDDFVDLKVAQGEAPPVAHDVHFTDDVSVPTNKPEAGASNKTYTWQFGVLYTGGPTVATFRVVVSLTANLSEESWDVTIKDTVKANTNAVEDQPGVFVRDIQLTAGQMLMLPVTIWTPATKATTPRTGAFTVAIESVDNNLSPAVKATKPGTFTVNVIANT
ncbi:MAG TPA: hypothetical protein VF588_00500 [Pyrinomonadaceae bacterium]|jgi:hypothetical protein